MISHIDGILSSKDIDRVEVMTSGGVGYELQIPLGVFETLPKQGEKVSLHTHLVVKEDGWQLFGFSSVFERRLFQKLLTANGVGPALALGLMSALSAPRLVRAIQEKDIPTLQGVPRVGRKKAERLILDLADKLDSIGGRMSREDRVLLAARRRTQCVRSCHSATRQQMRSVEFAPRSMLVAVACRRQSSYGPRSQNSADAKKAGLKPVFEMEGGHA
jgi:Holliday junction resolvasome, DNA-binding subunit